MLESEAKPTEESVASAENVGQEQAASDAPTSGDENKPTESTETKAEDISAEKTVDSVGANVEQTPAAVAEGEPKPEAAADAKPADGGEKAVDSIEKALEAEGSETTIESDIDSDFDVMEEIDPSYEIDASLWKKVADLNEVDLKPEKKDAPENDDKDKEEKKPKKKEVVVEEEEEDSGFSELVTVRSEKDRDQEFQEYIRELCRPTIVSYLPDRVAPKGSNVRLTCTVQGNNVQMKWMKDDVVLERGKRLQTKTDGEIHTLEISEITEKDAGVYSAVFKNRAGEVETSSRVKVYDGKLHKPDHIDIALVKGELRFERVVV